MKIDIRCPFCGQTDERELTNSILVGKTLTWCDPDVGGCDKEFAFKVGYEVRVSYFTLEALEVRSDG